jgi:hypothetical protein
MYYLPAHWQEWLDRNGPLMPIDFSVVEDVVLEFEDGSTARFRYAFYEVDEERREIAVFTEHCGYHVFSTLGLTYRKER